MFTNKEKTDSVVRRYEEDDELKFNRISNAHLTCKDCKFRVDDDLRVSNTTICLHYRNIKPDKVLGGGNCERKVKE